MGGKIRVGGEIQDAIVARTCSLSEGQKATPAFSKMPDRVADGSSEASEESDAVTLRSPACQITMHVSLADAWTGACVYIVDLSALSEQMQARALLIGVDHSSAVCTGQPDADAENPTTYGRGSPSPLEGQFATQWNARHHEHAPYGDGSVDSRSIAGACWVVGSVFVTAVRSRTVQLVTQPSEQVQNVPGARSSPCKADAKWRSPVFALACRRDRGRDLQTRCDNEAIREAAMRSPGYAPAPRQAVATRRKPTNTLI